MQHTKLLPQPTTAAMAMLFVQKEGELKIIECGFSFTDRRSNTFVY